MTAAYLSERKRERVGWGWVGGGKQGRRRGRGEGYLIPAPNLLPDVNLGGTRTRGQQVTQRQRQQKAESTKAQPQIETPGQVATELLAAFVIFLMFV